MRRLMLGMSQEKLADQLGLTFQQVQKYEKGTNRVSASRLQQMCSILDVPVSFFFEDAPRPAGRVRKGGEFTTDVVADFVASADGHALLKAFVRIRDKAVQRCIVRLVEDVASKAKGAKKDG